MDWLRLVQQHRAVAVIRAPEKKLGEQMARSVAIGGMRLIEITWDSDRAAELIAQLRGELSDCVIGTGTLLNRAELETAIAAGAQFLFTPHTQVDLIQLAVNHEIPIIPGALSPTEIVTAWQVGASSVKVFPIQAMGGAAYIKSLQGPLGTIPLIPTGGVTVTNAQAFLRAGAIAVGLAGDLFPVDALRTGDWQMIVQRSQTLIQSLASFRSFEF